MVFTLSSAGFTGRQAGKADLSSAVASSKAQTGKDASDVRYLLVRRAGRPERNYYELTRTATFLEPQLFNDEVIRRLKPSQSGFSCDIVSEYTVRYGVYQAWKVRVIRILDSQKAPVSTKVSVYVLVYPRHPDWKFCARNYRIESSNNGERKIIYTDFQDGRESTFVLSPEWPRPWQIYEIGILNSNAFPEIWQASKQPNSYTH